MKHSTKSRTKQKPSNFEFEAIGTWWEITFEAEDDSAESLKRKITGRIEEFDKTYSRFRDDSWVNAISGKAGTYTLPPEAGPLFEMYKDLYEATGGEVTPLIGQVLVDAGYDAAYSLEPKQLTTPPKWEDAILLNSSELTLKRPAILDFGAAGKGYLIDIIGTLLRENGVKTFTIDAGGDILNKDEKLRVGLEHPDDPKKVIGVVEIGNQSICASSGNRRAWKGFNHIISPTELASPTRVKAVWSVAETALVADGVATGLFFAEPAVLAGHFKFEYVIMYADGSARYSPSLNIELF